MSDFIDAIAAHLDREPSMCACGHPSVLHAARVGCVAVPWGEGPPCECYDAEGRPPCRCGHPSVLHADVGCLTSPANDGVLCPCRANGRDAAGRPPCRCGHFLAEHTDRVGCTARWEHDSGSDVCPCEETP
jgi:hypothetical protein